ncbi:hypothetical protein EYC80_010351 [Monilinia laxa]|uniref:Uncharacterized protein n=1 Tax=Monilinia laxa TaxID=61186 RepID=A0A5N6JNH0_MONLA|nr:hypothetical protein EYC80_010351 [Monilinia laxa]
MTANKHKKSPPRKSAQHPSPHKSQKPRKSHKSPRENVTHSKASNPIFNQNSAGVTRPILPPTRRLLFPQCSNSSSSMEIPVSLRGIKIDMVQEINHFLRPPKEEAFNQNSEQQSFSSPSSSKKDNQHMKKKTVSSQAAKLSDSRPSKRQCLPSTTNKTESSTPAFPTVDKKPRMKIENDDDGYDTPSPHSRKRKASAHKRAFEGYNNAPLTMAVPPNVDVSVVIPTKQCPSSSFSSTLRNSAASSQANVAILRLEKEKLQRRLDASVQETQEAKQKVEEQKKATEEWLKKYQAATSENLQNQREFKERRQASNTLLTQERHQSHHHLAKLTQQISTLQAQNSASQKQNARSSSSHLKATNQLLAKQIAQLQTAGQSQTQQIALLKQQVAQAPDPHSQASLHTRELEQQLAQLTSDLDFKNELASQAVRTHALETSALDQQIAYLRAQLHGREVGAEEASRLVDEVRELRDRVLGKEEEVASLKVEHAEVVKRLEGEVQVLRGGDGRRIWGWRGWAFWLRVGIEVEGGGGEGGGVEGAGVGVGVDDGEM